MEKQKTLNFSHDLKNESCIEGQIEKVAHPLVKQILSKVLAEDVDGMSLGSSFGEGQFAG